VFNLVADEFWRINEPFHDLMGSINLVVQIIILLMIYLGVRFKRRNDLVAHGNMMIIAVIVNFISVVLVMVPSIIYYYVSEPTKLGYSFGRVHAVIGGVAMALSLWMTVPWAARGSNSRFCAGKRAPMIVTAALWVLSILMGFVEYIIHVVLNV
jgi:uncharacterized membrane protein YozB (DUF420 family)